MVHVCSSDSFGEVEHTGSSRFISKNVESSSRLSFESLLCISLSNVGFRMEDRGKVSQGRWSTGINTRVHV